MIHHGKNQIPPIIILEAMASPRLYIRKNFTYCTGLPDIDGIVGAGALVGVDAFFVCRFMAGGVLAAADIL